MQGWPLCLICIAAGCSGPEKGVTDKTYVTREGVVNESPTLTPVQRAERFQHAFNAGMHWAEQKQYALALGAFEEAVDMNPASTEALFNLGACYEQIGDPFKAIQIYRQILRYSPNDPLCYGNLGTSYIKLYHTEKSPVWRSMAMDSWRHALQLNPDQPEVRKFLAMAESDE